MNILLIGSGGREHALAWKIAQSPLLGKLYIAPGNPGTASFGENTTLDVSHHQAVIDFCARKAINLVVIGPETPLVNGLVDALTAEGIKAFGPTKAAAQLEGSKGFTKELCVEAGILTAAFARFSHPDLAKAYLADHPAPIVIKADGLAAGKGVVVAQTDAEASAAIDMMFAGSMGAAGHEIVMEECLFGEEVSFFALCDGLNAIPFGTAQDHKRAFDGDTGPNTGGMGAYSPAPILTPALADEVMNRIIMPTLRTMQARGTPYKGILYAGLMLTDKGPQLIEYNCRFGDPECQVLMMRLHSDLVPLMLSSIDGSVSETTPLWSSDPALTVVMAAKGYPGAVEKGSIIQGLDQAERDENVTIFHAGTQRQGEHLTSNGGRVLNVTAKAATLREARDKAYQAVATIHWPEGFCRTDIGWRAL
jgi:phosphoribosylamine---glycine ligase